MTLEDNASAEIARADPRARRVLFFVLALGVAAGAFLISIGESQLPALEHWITADRALIGQRLRTILAVMAVLMVGPPLLIAVYFWRLSSRIVRGDRFPPEGMRLTRDVRVVRGEDARRRARLLRGVAIAFGLTAVGALGMLWRLVTSLPA